MEQGKEAVQSRSHCCSFEQSLIRRTRPLSPYKGNWEQGCCSLVLTMQYRGKIEPEVLIVHYAQCYWLQRRKIREIFLDRQTVFEKRKDNRGGARESKAGTKRLLA
jgi:hypothetical protein